MLTIKNPTDLNVLPVFNGQQIIIKAGEVVKLPIDQAKFVTETFRFLQIVSEKDVKELPVKEEVKEDAKDEGVQEEEIKEEVKEEEVKKPIKKAAKKADK